MIPHRRFLGKLSGSPLCANTFTRRGYSNADLYYCTFYRVESAWSRMPSKTAHIVPEN